MKAVKTRKKFNKSNIILAVIAIVLILWIGLSFIEIITHNSISYSDYTYNSYNFFTLLLKLCY